MNHRKSAVTATCFVVAALTLAPSASAQLLPGAVATDTLTRALLAPGSWLLNFPDTALGNITGNALLTFQASGAQMTVNIRIATANVSCERPVTATPEGIAFDGCRETGIVLRFTPQDPVFAFRGASAQRWYTLRPHQ
jgi:hypothetical protein